MKQNHCQTWHDSSSEEEKVASVSRGWRVPFLPFLPSLPLPYLLALSGSFRPLPSSSDHIANRCTESSQPVSAGVWPLARFCCVEMPVVKESALCGQSARGRTTLCVE